MISHVSILQSYYSYPQVYLLFSKLSHISSCIYHRFIFLKKAARVPAAAKTFIYCKANSKRISDTMLHVFPLIHLDLIEQ